jgi:hypothetical protein
MLFLQTETGSLIAGKFITRIGALNTRPNNPRRWHEIDYVHGQDGCSTTASEDAVQDFLDEAQS